MKHGTILSFWGCFIFIIIAFVSCEPTEPVMLPIEPSLADEQVQQIINLQDKRDAKGLLAYFSSENPTYRYMAAMAAGSVQDSILIDSLSSRLSKEPYEETRILLAYALGQTKNKAAIPAIIQPFKTEPSRAVQGALLEAIGKCGTEKELEFLAKTKPYPGSEVELHTGLLRGLFRFSVNNITSSDGTKKVINEMLIPNLPVEASIAGATYLKRARNIDLSLLQADLFTILDQAKNVQVKMNMVSAIGRIASPEAFSKITAVYSSETDYRVRCEVVRSLRRFDYSTTKELALKALDDNHPQVRICAADHFLANGASADNRLYFDLAVKYQDDPEIYSKLMAALLRNTPSQKVQTKDFFTRKILVRLDSTSNPYEKAAYLTALQEHVFNYQIIARHTFKPESPAVVRTAGISALAYIRQLDNFRRMFGQFSGSARVELDRRLKEAISSGDVAMVGIAAGVYQNPDLAYKDRLSDLSFLEMARDSMELPRDVEGWYAIQQTIDFLKGNPVKPAEPPAWNHPIDYSLLTGKSDTIQATIELSSGTVQLDLYPIFAPGTVSNFIKLSQASYYDDKTIHRVVPNFVIQGGCPRGDGWGSEDYSIRSEIGAQYYDDEGYIGIASAGKDTEGVQWFITHSATPHLDGRYTIFGKVTSGMKAVHDTRVGDQIKSVKVQ